jgi:hypothetical protein
MSIECGICEMNVYQGHADSCPKHPDNKIKYSAPWKEGILAEWAICGMNHYHMNGKRYLFVSMVQGDRCITQEGLDDADLWMKLVEKA